MKTVAAAIAAVSLVAGPVCEVRAAGSSKTHQRRAKRYYRHARPTVEHQPTYPDASGWYPRDASKLPFGSALWWDQMMREGRLMRNGGDKQFTWRGRPIFRIVYCFGCRCFCPASLYLRRAWAQIAVRQIP